MPHKTKIKIRCPIKLVQILSVTETKSGDLSINFVEDATFYDDESGSSKYDYAIIERRMSVHRTEGKAYNTIKMTTRRRRMPDLLEYFKTTAVKLGRVEVIYGKQKPSLLGSSRQGSPSKSTTQFLKSINDPTQTLLYCIAISRESIAHRADYPSVEIKTSEFTLTLFYAVTPFPPPDLGMGYQPVMSSSVGGVASSEIDGNTVSQGVAIEGVHEEIDRVMRYLHHMLLVRISRDRGYPSLPMLMQLIKNSPTKIWADPLGGDKLT